MNIAILGVLAPHKGREVVRQTVEATTGLDRNFIIIGFSDPPLSDLRNLSETGPYKEETLVDQIRELKIDVIWFPSQVPETFSYTLSAAIASGKPIVATRIGAFVERLKHYPLARLEDVDVRPETWLASFDLALQDARTNSRRLAAPKTPTSQGFVKFYPHGYLSMSGDAHLNVSASTDAVALELNQWSIAGSPKVLPCRRTKVVLIPERLDDGRYSPCAYIRLLYPYEFLRSSGEIDCVVVGLADALMFRADVFVLQRYSLRTLSEVERLIAWVKKIGARLVYDLDDNLLDVADNHPEEQLIGERSPIVRALLQRASVVTVSTQQLLGAVEKETSGGVVVIRNALEGSLVKQREAARVRSGRGTVGILYMGTMTHERDLKLVSPALRKLSREYSGKLRIGVIGVARGNLPSGIVRVEVPNGVQATYPAFFSWLQRLTDWQIGIAPLEDNGFNQAKSDIKALDYMSMGLIPVVSDVVSYSELPDEAAVKVGNSSGSWERSLRAILEDENLQSDVVKKGHDYLMSERLISSLHSKNKLNWKRVLGLSR